MKWSVNKIAGAVIAIAVLGLLLWLSVRGKPTILPPDTSGSNASSTTGEWKTYRNEKYGVKFRYPANTTVSEHGTYVFNSRGGGLAFRVEKRANPSIVIEIISSVENPSNKTIENWMREEMGRSYDRIEKNSIKMGESSVFVATSEKSPGAFGYEDYFFVANKKIRFVSFAVTGGYNTELRDRFLGGLRFIQ
mgnify:FL=1